MLFPRKTLLEINKELDLVLTKFSEFEVKYQPQLKRVHPNYSKSALNLIHYLALRTFRVDRFQEKLSEIGLPNISGSENNILSSVLSLKTLICSLLNIEVNDTIYSSIFLTNKEAKQLLKINTRNLFGPKKNNRKTNIMVTQPTIAATDKEFAKSLIETGMNCARINCAHDNEIIWKQIIENIKEIDSNCMVTMDLGGPKLRTGKMTPGHKVIHIKPKRNTLGQVTVPSRIWLAPYGTLPPDDETFDAIIPVNKKWLTKTTIGSFIIFRDARNKKCRIDITETDGKGRWGVCSDSAFVTTGTLLNVFFEKKSSAEIHSVHELLPLEEVIFLYEGDLLRIDKNPVLGAPATYNKSGKIEKLPHISCTLPRIFESVKIGEFIYFDDGKIEGLIKDIFEDYLIVEITSTKKNGGKLKADKGINLPQTQLNFSGLTKKDKDDLKFISQFSDLVNFSFVNSKKDVQELLDELKKLKAQLGIIIKVETNTAFKNLPSILLKAMENYPVGVMIARGDLAIETGWKNFAIIQEEILQLCDAAHLPDVWATQVLENLAKKGIPTRAEITDAGMSQRAECVMLNKGPYILKAVKMLDKILRRMEKIQKKKRAILPKLEFNEDL